MSSLEVGTQLDGDGTTDVLDGACCNQVCMILHLTGVTFQVVFGRGGAGRGLLRTSRP
ncbi:MAG: hypothetical protein WAK89_02755 [Candidatus Sulfotelmatobacter sp.]